MVSDSETRSHQENLGACEDCGVLVNWRTKRRWRCEACQVERDLESSRRSRSNNTDYDRGPTIERARARKYGISVEELRVLIAEGCAVCTNTEEVCVDHDPITNMIRGPLCQADNMSAGKLLHDPERLRRLADYLEATAIDSRTVLGGVYKLATDSPDPSTQIGVVLCHETSDQKLIPIHQTAAHNRPVSGWSMTESDWERPRKYSLVEHAERNSLFAAAKKGIATEGLVMVATWSACQDCARGMVACGIKKLVRHCPPQDEATERWRESVAVGDEILVAGGVDIMEVLGPIPEAFPILRGGTWFDPSRPISEEQDVT